jgi:hypothetical protein
MGSLQDARGRAAALWTDAAAEGRTEIPATTVGAGDSRGSVLEFLCSLRGAGEVEVEVDVDVDVETS